MSRVRRPSGSRQPEPRPREAGVIDLADIPRVTEEERCRREDADRRAFWLEMQLQKAESRAAELSMELEIARDPGTMSSSEGNLAAVTEALIDVCSQVLKQPSPDNLRVVGTSLKPLCQVDRRLASLADRANALYRPSWQRRNSPFVSDRGGEELSSEPSPAPQYYCQ